MEILINNDLNSTERYSFAEKVSQVLNHCDFESNAHKMCEVVNVYTKKVEKVRKNKNYFKDGFLPFLFIVNKN